MDNDTLATEILHEMKLTNKRLFIAFIISIALNVVQLIGFIWYISLPIEEYSIEQSADNQSGNMIVGGDYNGETKGNLP